MCINSHTLTHIYTHTYKIPNGNVWFHYDGTKGVH